MELGLWSRMGLRWQTAAAVLLPCLAAGLFASVYFPRRMNAQAQAALASKASALGEMATSQIAPRLGLFKLGAAPVDDLDKVFEALRAQYAAFVWADPSRPLVQATEASVARRTEFFPVGMTYERPPTGCEVDHQERALVLRCRLVDPVEVAAEGLLVAAFDKSELLAAQRQNQLTALWMLIAIALAGLALAFWFSRALATPVALVTQAARVVASGDVTVSAVQVSATGEIRSMANSFNEMLHNLRNLVGQMVALTGRLASASQGLIGASKDQEHVTTQQAAYAQQIAATFEELSRTAEQISASTEVVETAARRTTEAVDEAKAVVAQVVARIGEMRSQSKEVADAILTLNEDLQQVSKIAHVINTVAERSDLLALNAALEGTKAGEVGKGFSLVAAEMRKLAENVSGSAKDIGRIVETVQESGGEAANKARVGMASSDRGMQVAEQASAVFVRIAELARGTSDAAQQIAVASRQQRQSSEQAVLGARNVADLVKQGVDATGQTTRIAQDLQQVAQALNDVTGKFKVEREGRFN